MKIWVIAFEGMLGRAVYKYLQEKNIDVVGTTHFDVDITEKEKVISFAKENNFTHMINCAAYTEVDKAEENQELSYLVNAEAVKNLGETAKALSIKVIHFSTDYVFDGKNRSSYKEQDECSPCNVYGWTKWHGEKLLIQTKAKALIIRTSWLFGYEKNSFVSKMLKLMKEKEKITVVDDQWGRPTFCIDLVKAMFSLFPYEGIFHFANEGIVNWHIFAKTIFSFAQSNGIEVKCSSITPVKSENFQTLARRPFYSVLDTKKYEKLTDSKPRLWIKALKEYMEKICEQKIGV